MQSIKLAEQSAYEVMAMSKTFIRILFSSLLLVFGGQTLARAGILTGQDLLEICEPARIDPTYRLRLSECTGYIIGVADSFDCSNKVLGFNWDSKQYANQKETVAAVVDWLHFHPNVLHYQASGLVASALAKSYPCSSSIASQ